MTGYSCVTVAVLATAFVAAAARAGDIETDPAAIARWIEELG